MAIIVSNPSFSKSIKALDNAGKKRKEVQTQALAAQSAAANFGEITLKRTGNGETRIENVIKYDLNDGYRLVVHKTKGKEPIFTFLFVGDHEDTEKWLNNNKNNKWVRDEKNILQFIQVSDISENYLPYVEPNLLLSEDQLKLPLLRKLDKKDFGELNLSPLTVNYIFQITGQDWETDPNGILEYIEKSDGIEKALFLGDLFTTSHNGQYGNLEMRVKLQSMKASLPNDEELAEAINDPINSELFVTWEEINALPENSSWADWLLFLHPEQKKIAYTDFNGSARLRGVSGSGKTCVMLHRARYLAKKYQKPILLITLTESMRKLLDILIKDLCGVESSYIYTSTVNSLGEKIINDIHPKGISVFMKPKESAIIANEKEVVKFIKSHSFFDISQLRNMSDHEIKDFINDEYNYVMGRLSLSELDAYLDSKQFLRKGRKIRLTKDSRQLCYDAIKYKLSRVVEVHQLDYSCIIQGANALLKHDQISLNMLGWKDLNIEYIKENINNVYSPYRCILVDEVQDLSQLEVEMIAKIPVDTDFTISDVEDGLFLVGDGAQTIYNKGFVLKNCGVNVANRSYVLKKNYRNSYEIMKAAYSLIEKYEYADVDEDNIQKPTIPDFPNKLGEKPFLVKCCKLSDEVEFIVFKIEAMIQDYQQLNETTGYPEICVVGLNKSIRNSIQEKLRVKNIICNELRDSVGIDKQSISISTIESAKGHEFQIVFIANVIAGLLPRNGSEENLSREASRLYVAMTRAQEKLYITYSIEGNNTPSPFLINIQKDCTEFEYKKGDLGECK